MTIVAKMAQYLRLDTRNREISPIDANNSLPDVTWVTGELWSNAGAKRIYLVRRRSGKLKRKFCEDSFANIIRRKSKIRTIIIAFGIAALAANAPVKAQTRDLVPRGNEQPSFDCSTARTATARLICADLELTRLDHQLGTVFQKQKLQVYLPDQTRFVTDELAWIRERNERCGLVRANDAAIEMLASSKSCLMAAIQERIVFLNNMEQRTSAVPSEEQSSRILAPSSAQSSQPQTIWPDPQKAIGMQSSPITTPQPQQQQTAGSVKFENAKQQGYRVTSFEDFKLDGKQLSEANAKLIMHGVYSKSGDIEILQPSGLAVAMARREYGNNLGVPLLTEAASRDVRKYFLNCSSNIAAQLGCPITLVGHADVCSAINLLESKNLACLVVEDGW